MKYTAGILLVLFFIQARGQNENTITIWPTIENVTVFLKGAEFRHEHDIRLKAGRNKIVFKNITGSLNESNMNVLVKGNTQVLSVAAEWDFLTETKSKDRFSALRDSIDKIREEIGSVADELDAVRAEKGVLQHNQEVKGGAAGVSLTELQKAAEFHRIQTLRINKTITQLSGKAEMLKKRHRLMEQQMQEGQTQGQHARKNIVVVVQAASDQQSVVSLRYLATEAGWVAKYDIIAEDINKPITLKYKADVYNRTGIDWYKVKIKLSTADPFLGVNKPALSVWNLNYHSEQNEGYVETKSLGVFQGNTFSDSGKSNTGDQTLIAVGELSTEFLIDLPYDILSDSKPYSVSVVSYTLPATYQYYAAPKLDKDAFLIARIGGWEKLNLIDGPASIYFNDTYIGVSDINTRKVEDSLELSLGRNNQVLITRAKRQNFSSKKMVGTNRTVSFIYEIAVKNNRREAVTMEIEDQLPVSQESDIVVETSELSGAQLDPLTGKLTWYKTLTPGESVNYILSYSIKYPKNRRVNIATPKITPRYL